MQAQQPKNGLWVFCDSRDALIAQMHAGCEIVETENPNRWGYMDFGPSVAIPIGYSDMGLQPSAVQFGECFFVGINELLIGWDSSGCSMFFKYKMPTIFHEFVRFDQHEFVVRDEIGFVGVSYFGDERWCFCVDVISSYKIDRSLISGVTDDGEEFRFSIPTG